MLILLSITNGFHVYIKWIGISIYVVTKMFLLVNIFVILNVVTSGYVYNFLLIKDYLKLNYINTVIFISCGSTNEPDGIQTINYLQRHGIWINVWDISNKSVLSDYDFDTFFARRSHPPCIVVNLECNQISEFMTKISKAVLFHNERNWLMFSESWEAAFDILSRQNINFDAEIVLVIPKGRYEDYDVYEVFNPSQNRGGRLNITQLGKWNGEIGWNIPLKQTKIERRRDLNGITFPSVITLTNIPNQTTFMEHLNSNDFVHLDSMNRLMFRLFVLMMNMFNFTVHLQLADIWGSVDSNGNWHGAIGMMNRSEVDFCLTGLRWDNNRYGVFEQTTSAYYVQALFIFRHPKSVYAANVFLLPFDGTVWCAIIALGVLSAYIVCQTFSVENHKNVRNFFRTKDVNENSYTNSMLMVFGFIFQQSYYGHPLLTSSRIITLSMLVFSVLIFQFYSSFIVGSLLTEFPKNIKTVAQLLNSRLEFGIDVVPYIADNFHNSKEESTVQLYNKIMKNPEKALMPLQTGLRLLKKGGFAFNTDGSYAYNILKHMLTDSETCELQEIRYVPKIPVGPGVPNKSPFKELLKISIRKFTETGILSYYNKVWYGIRPRCETSELIVAPVDIVHFSSALYILIVGILCSITILMFEIVTALLKT